MPMNRKHKRQNTQGAEAGFTLIELIIVITIASILGTFVFSIITKSLVAQINMQRKKERSDEAVLSLERISRELIEARYIDYADNNELRFEKRITSSTDPNPWIRYARDTSTNILWRQSADLLANLPSDSTPGNIVAENVTVFNSSGSNLNAIEIDLTFANGSVWKTVVFPMNYGL
jgi:prepilin-type N-terminal cleavage/methylation domain-containing protein